MNIDVWKIKGKEIQNKLVISSEENQPQVGLNKFLFHVSQNALVYLEGLIPIIMTVVICHFHICPPKPSSSLWSLSLPADLLVPDLWEKVEAVPHCTPLLLPPVSDKGSLSPVYCWSLFLCSSSKRSPPGACSKLFLLCTVLSFSLWTGPFLWPMKMLMSLLSEPVSFSPSYSNPSLSLPFPR